MISYSQNFEDVMLNRFFNGKKSGFYIDVGAFDPVLFSDTKHFYDLGWTGINIEPNANGHELLKEARPNDINLNIALADKNGKKPIYIVYAKDREERDASAMSSFSLASVKKCVERFKKEFGIEMYFEKVMVPVRTLASVCEEYCDKPVDFLKIDVEGAELQVLQGADLEKFRPTLLIVEAKKTHTNPLKQAQKTYANWGKFEPIILDAGYEHVYFDGLNRFYLAKEHARKKSAFSVPLCFYDRFITASENDWKLKNEELQNRVWGQKAEIAQTREVLEQERERLSEEQKAHEATREAVTQEQQAHEATRSELKKLEESLQQRSTELEEAHANIESEKQAHEDTRQLVEQEKQAHEETRKSVETEKQARSEVEQKLKDETQEHANTKNKLFAEHAGHQEIKRELTEEQEAHEETRQQLETEKALVAETREALSAEQLAHEKALETLRKIEEELAQVRLELSDTQEFLGKTQNELQSEIEAHGQTQQELGATIEERDALQALLARSDDALRAEQQEHKQTQAAYEREQELHYLVRTWRDKERVRHDTTRRMLVFKRAELSRAKSAVGAVRAAHEMTQMNLEREIGETQKTTFQLNKEKEYSKRLIRSLEMQVSLHKKALSTLATANENVDVLCIQYDRLRNDAGKVCSRLKQEAVKYRELLIYCYAFQQECKSKFPLSMLVPEMSLPKVPQADVASEITANVWKYGSAEQVLKGGRKGIAEPAVEIPKKPATDAIDENATAGKYLFYPNKTGKRKAEGGLRMKGIRKKSMPGKPLVSVVTSVFNCKAHFEQAMKSVFAQTYPNIEYIVVDACSTDGSLDILFKYKTKLDYYISEPDKGIYQGMNKGVSLATGDYVIVLNADDYYEPDAIEVLVKKAMETKADITAAHANFMDPDGKTIFINKSVWDARVHVASPLRHETMLITKKAYDELGPYDESYAVVSDRMWMRGAYKAKKKVAICDKVVLNFRTEGVSSVESPSYTAEKDRVLRDLEPKLTDLEVAELRMPWKASRLSLQLLREKYAKSTDLVQALNVFIGK